MRVGGQFAALAAVVVGVEGEAGRVERLEQHDARGGPAVRADRGQRHGVRLRHLRGQRLPHPGAELADRVGVGVGFTQAGAGVVAAEVGERHGASFRRRRPPGPDGGGVHVGVVVTLALQFAQAVGRRQLHKTLESQRQGEVRDFALHHFREVNGAVARVEPRFHPAVQPADGAAENGAARGGGSHVQAVELVAGAAGLQAEAPDPIELVLAEEVQGEGAGRLDQLPGVVLPGQADDHARQLRDDGGFADERGDQAAAAAAGLGRHQPQFPVQPGEQSRGGGVVGHGGVLFRSGGRESCAF